MVAMANNTVIWIDTRAIAQLSCAPERRSQRHVLQDFASLLARRKALKKLQKLRAMRRAMRPDLPPDSERMEGGGRVCWPDASTCWQTQPPCLRTSFCGW